MAVNKNLEKGKTELSKYIKILLIVVGIGIFAIFIGILSRYNFVGNMDLLLKEVQGDKIKTESGVYEGDFLSLLRDNHDGQFYFNCGDSYSGEWDSLEIDGSGTYKYKGYGTYTGEFVDGLRCGEGEFVWDNGNEYYGNWLNDKLNGEGELITKNGKVLKGTFVDNVLENGTYEIKKGKSKYVFSIVDGLIDYNGNLSVRFFDGSKYNGTFSKKGLYGHGIITYKNGDKYEGEIKNGKKSGDGTYIWSSGSEYKGEWANDKMNGEGTYNGEADVNYIISGNFKNGKPNGRCVCEYGDDSYYTTWKDGKCTKVEGENDGY